MQTWLLQRLLTRCPPARLLQGAVCSVCQWQAPGHGGVHSCWRPQSHALLLAWAAGRALVFLLSAVLDHEVIPDLPPAAAIWHAAPRSAAIKLSSRSQLLKVRPKADRVPRCWPRSSCRPEPGPSVQCFSACVRSLSCAAKPVPPAGVTTRMWLHS